MPLLVTDAMVLHSANYLESSRIFRLATREAGMQSVVARGARSSKKRFGTAVDLFAVGQAQIDVRPGRDLHALNAFDVTNSQTMLVADLGRFSAASAIAECALRVVHDEAAPIVFDGLLAGFAALARSDGDRIVPMALGILWRLVRDVGVAPTLDVCANCHAPLTSDDEVRFSHSAGGVLCERCGARAPGSRKLPASARQAILSWMQDGDAELSNSEARAHQRLLREFVGQHLTDGRPLRAYADWEHGGLAAIPENNL